jgi:hypothetical protein
VSVTKASHGWLYPPISLANGKSNRVLGQLSPEFARTLNATKPVLVGEIALDCSE